jgi:radical SAM superfamily enzyme YgiQ (UPF0313 family)
MGKRHVPHDAIEVTRFAIGRGIVPMHNFIFGTPGETASDRRQSLRLIDHLRGMNRWVAFTFRFFQPAWNTPMGEAAIASAPDYPRRLTDILAHRAFLGDPRSRAMGWLSPGTERTIKAMVYYYLPMITSRVSVEGRARCWLYRGLRAVARLRLRVGWFGLEIDRWLYDRLLGARLDCTFTP